MPPDQHHHEEQPDDPSSGSPEACDQGLAGGHDVARRGVEDHEANCQSDHQQPKQAVAVGCPGDGTRDEITRSNGAEDEDEPRAESQGASAEPRFRLFRGGYLGGQVALRGWLGMDTLVLETQFQAELDLATFRGTRDPREVLASRVFVKGLHAFSDG